MTLQHRPSKNGSRHRNVSREHSRMAASHPCARDHYETLRKLHDDSWKHKTGAPNRLRCRNHREGGDPHPSGLRLASVLIRLFDSIHLRPAWSNARGTRDQKGHTTLPAEGEGFEPPGLSPNCFQDSRNRPLCHPSADSVAYQTYFEKRCTKSLSNYVYYWLR